MERENIHDWLAREKDITKAQWEMMLLPACNQYLKELQSRQDYSGPIYKDWQELEDKDPICADELGGEAERILAASYGWTTYISKPE